MKRKLIPPKRSPRSTEQRRCSENLRRLVIGYRALLEDELRDQGLTLPQLRLLKAIQQQAGVSAAALARTCSVTPQTLQAVLARAVREQWIVRGRSLGNSRIVTASLTPRGEAVLERGKQMAARIEEKLWHGVNLATLKDLNRILETGIANLDQESRRSGPAQNSQGPQCSGSSQHAR
jgi:MarR family transcriptional regulator, organic hydroperoxide resistance regulator